MYVDDSALQDWADPDLIDSAADDAAAAGRDIQEAGQSAKASWAGLSGTYRAPEQGVVHSALDRVATRTADVGDGAELVAAALREFASEVRGLVGTRDALQAEIAVNNARTYTDQVREETTYFNLTGRTSELAMSYADLVYRYADRINGLAHQPLDDVSNLSNGLDYSGVLYSIPENTKLTPYYRSIAQEAADAWGIWHSGMPQYGTARYAYQLNGVLHPPSGLIHPEQLGGSVRPSAASIPTLPSHLRAGSKALGVAGVGLAIYGAYGDQYNEDLAEHPEWSESQRQRSAVTNAAVVGGSSAAGGWAGAAIGAQWGATIGMAGGPVGAVVGGIVGGAIGGFVGSQAGEMVGEAIMDVGDAVGDVWNSLWD
ncbi:hypothetical protein D477_019066 [Arthrobacter crystallopoietes BAB-32]|uniref:Glycine zipper domain-containing protein n=1 Tax=Arthrobacter crystallopoietes BAB-32 TaxID=1246476 RepID=N1UQJ3_9MICC|nr:hypothetical protein [Arthrobacter crystallopoietes]EMY32661.1 hypothetical protein D477_019066 [Arthrobacter crystallopoietes BAB-32]